MDFLSPQSSFALRNPQSQPRREGASADHAAIRISYFSPPLPLSQHSLGDHRQGVACARDVDRGAVFVANHPARPERHRVDDGEEVIDVLHAVHGSRDLDGAVVREVARHHAAQGRASPVRLDGKPLDAHAATLQRASDAQRERRLFGLPR
jgi:hypothetical protein